MSDEHAEPGTGDLGTQDPAAPGTPPGAAPGAPAAPGDGKTLLTEGEDGSTGGEGGDGKPEGAPEEYADFTLPEGFDPETSLDQEMLTDFKGLARELGLSQANAQRVFELAPRLIQKAAEAQAQAFDKLRETWRSQIDQDEAFQGAKRDENLAVAKRALLKLDEKIGGHGVLRELMNDYGLGDHPAMLRAFYEVGLLLEEDTGAEGGAGVGQERELTPAEVMYPNEAAASSQGA